MLVVIIILAWLLINTLIALAIICVDEGCRGTEWIGVIIAYLFCPLIFFIIRLIVLFIKKIKRRTRK